MIITPNPSHRDFMHIQVINKEYEDTLKRHFTLFYKIFVDSRLIPQARSQTFQGVKRFLSGVPSPFNNALIGCPQGNLDEDMFIEEQINYFKDHNVPFVWYIDQEAQDSIKGKLLKKGFTSLGMFRGVIGHFSKPFEENILDAKYSLERVTEATLPAFNDLVCATFHIEEIAKEQYEKVLLNESMGHNPILFHWMVKCEGRVVSALSTMVEGHLVSFWNGATLPEFRRQGLSGALRRVALNHAISSGCDTGLSYLMSEGMALGLCKKLGFETHWRFDTFLFSP